MCKSILCNFYKLLTPNYVCRIIPESPRWLLVSGNEQEAINILAGFAQGNRAEMPANLELKKTTVETSGQEAASLRDLFTGKNIRHRTTILCLAW